MRKFYAFCLFLLLFGFLAAQVQIQAPMPNQTGTFAGNVRGYWFTSPTCFTITGLEVPTTANSGPQSIAVVRLQSPPPFFSANTNVFTTLFLTQSNPTTGIINVNIQVEAGDIIGVLSQRNTVGSYSNTGNTTLINGQSITLNRLGMQFPLTTTAPQQLWTEAGSSISRCYIYYDSVLTFNALATPAGPNAFTFTNASDSSFSSVWDYGDGSPLDSSWNGSHTYSAGGTYNVCSYITTGCRTDTVCTTVTVCGPDPVSAYSASPAGFSVAFSDSSANAVAWHWDFGDGGTDTTQNPTHTYNAIGWYNVCLISMNGCAVADTLCDSVFVCVAPTASMSYSQTGRDTLVFADSSMYASSWHWDFGDGTTDSIQNPIHVYTSDGNYTICLVTENACGSDTVCTTVTICITPVNAAFTFSTTQFDVIFTDASAGGNTYSWDFGDGGTSTIASPTHTYAANGTYIACLTIGNNCNESATACDTVVIDVVGIAEALPGFEITVAPNPVGDQAIVMVSHAGAQGAYQFELMDLSGAKVAAVVGELQQPLILKASHLASGIYLFRVLQDGLTVGTGKLIVE
jgi:PKD repeat protein